MTPNSFLCACCMEYRSENDQHGEMWFGDPVCSFCVGSDVVAECSECSRFVEEKHATEDNADNWVCPECLPKLTRCDHCERPVPNDGWAGSHLETGPGHRGYLRCPRCVGGSNRTKVKRHPAAIANDALDQTMRDHLGRSV